MARVPKKTPKLKLRVTVSSEVKDYSKDPYFVKKAEEARKFLEKHPVPEKLLRNK